jgi:predicted O-linked N-acetylglucosamine transferase (SPINDLY family)
MTIPIDSLCTLGEQELSGGNLKNAATAFQRAIELRPAHAPAWNGLGRCFQFTGQAEQAMRCFDSALVHDPDHLPSRFGRAVILHDLGNLPEARRAYEELLKVAPGQAVFHNNLGTVLDAMQDLKSAERCYQSAIRLDARYATAWANLAGLKTRQNRVEEAREYYTRATGFDPADQVKAMHRDFLCPAFYADRDAIITHRAEYLEVLRRWQTTPPRCSVEALWQAGVCPPFNTLYHGLDERPLREAFSAMLAPWFTATSANRDVAPARTAHPGRTRVGLLVSPGHEGIFLRSMQGIIERLDARFRLFIVCGAPGKPALERALRRDELGFVILPGALEGMAAAIREAQLDILYHWEIGTDATNYMLPHYRLAPIQCTSWGIQVTSGVAAVDYYLSSQFAEPGNAQVYYTERLLLATAPLTYQIRVFVERPATETRRRYGWDSADHLYACIHQPGKIHPDFDHVLGGILRRDRKGKIVLTRDVWTHVSMQLEQRFRHTLADVADRIVFLPYLGSDEYLNVLAACNVTLNPPCYGGVNTTFDALSLGVPPVALEGDRQIARYAAGCLRHIGMHELVAKDLASYTEIATRLGMDEVWRSEVSARLRERSGALFENIESVREHERLFDLMVQETRP